MGFSINNITKDRLQSLIKHNIWKKDCPVHYSRLRIVEVPFINFDNKPERGELMVLDSLSESVAMIFEELVSIKFQIEKMIPMEEFKGDDILSMQANNSSAFNGRLVARTNRWSSHAYGCAIDINPVQNPYLLLDEELRLKEVIPKAGSEFLDRSNHRKGMVEEIVYIFAKHGFSEWGGSWEEKPDYHHFQIPWQEMEKKIS